MEKDVLDASDNSLITKVPVIAEDRVFSILQSAHEAFLDKQNWLKHHQKVEIFRNLVTIMEKQKDHLSLTIAKEGGKPLKDAKVEVERAIDGVHLAISELKSSTKGEQIPMGFSKPAENKLAFTIREPIGVVVAISAFNHPLNLAVHQIIPAIAAGCPVIIKPASSTPISAITLVEMLYQSGLPKRWASAMVMENSVASKMLADPRVAFMTFIGSSNVGWKLRNTLNKGARYSLEHGGAAPVIVDDTVKDIDEVAASIVKGGYYHAGQVCISVQRVFAHANIIDSLKESMLSKVKALKTGDAKDIETDVGPIISPSEVDRIHEVVQDAIESGAQLLTGGKKISNNFYEPTLLLNPSKSASISLNEVFGPVVALYTYNNLDSDAIQYANKPNLPFQAAVFSSDISNIMSAFYNIDANGIIVNDHSAFRVDWMPFGARRSAGAGVGGIGYAIHEMTNYKMMILNDKNIVS